MTERLRFLLVLAVLALAGFAGMTTLRSRSSDDGGSSSASQTVKQVMDRSGSMKSAKFRFEVKARVDGVPQLSTPFVVAGSGAFQSHGAKRTPDFDLTAGVTAEGINERAGVRLAKGALYVMEKNVFYSVASADRVRVLLRNGRSEDAETNIDFGKLMKDARHEGTETLDGVETDHVSAQLDVDAVIKEIDKQSASGEATPKMVRLLVDEAVTDAKVEAWVGKDGAIRKAAFHLAAQVPERYRAGLQGASGADLSMELSFTDVGKPQRIAVPRNARKGDLETTLGRGLSGGVLNAATNGGALRTKRGETAPAKPAGNAKAEDYDAQTREYLACVAQATKPDALQKCFAPLR